MENAYFLPVAEGILTTVTVMLRQDEKVSWNAGSEHTHATTEVTSPTTRVSLQESFIIGNESQKKCSISLGPQKSKFELRKVSMEFERKALIQDAAPGWRQSLVPAWAGQGWALHTTRCWSKDIPARG